MQGLMRYVTSVGVDSDEGKRIEALLPTMNIKRSELDLVQTVYPKFVASLRERLSAFVFLQTKGGDRIFMEDLLQRCRTRIKGVEWSSTPGGKTMT